MLDTNPKKEGKSEESMTIFGGKIISSVFFHIMKMGYATKKKAAGIFMKNILRNDNLLWMKNNVDEQVALFLITNSEDGWTDRIFPMWVKDNFFGGRGRMRQTFGFSKIIFRSCWNHLDFLMILH